MISRWNHNLVISLMIAINYHSIVVLLYTNHVFEYHSFRKFGFYSLHYKPGKNLMSNRKTLLKCNIRNSCLFRIDNEVFIIAMKLISTRKKQYIVLCMYMCNVCITPSSVTFDIMYIVTSMYIVHCVICTRNTIITS